MIWIIIALLGVLGAGLGVGIGIKVFNEPIKIEFKVSIANSFFQAFTMFFWITLAMSLELTFNQWQLETLKSAGLQLRIVSRLIDAGLIVALILPLLSMKFGRMVESLDLDLCSMYSENVIKIYYSLIAFTNCVWYLHTIAPDFMSDSVESNNIFSRAIIWMLNILGTWVGIGFHCKGRIGKELENINKSKEPIEWKEKVKYCIPFVIAFILTFLLLFTEIYKVDKFKTAFWTCYFVIMVMLLFMLISAMICKSIMYPSEKRSNTRLIRAIRKMLTLEIVSSHYQSLKYSLSIEGDNKYLIIHRRDIIWMGYETEVEDMFGEKRISMDSFDYRVCQQYLKDVVHNQREFIQKGFDTCRENAKIQLLDKMENRCL